MGMGGSDIKGKDSPWLSCVGDPTGNRSLDPDRKNTNSCPNSPKFLLYSSIQCAGVPFRRSRVEGRGARCEGRGSLTYVDTRY